MNRGLGGDGSLKKKHALWQQTALEDGQRLKKDLLEEEFDINITCEHPNKSVMEVEKEIQSKMSRYAIGMTRLRKMKKDSNNTLEGIIASKKHHLLHHEDKNVLIFGDDKAIQRLATTKTINSDGTFSCVIPGFAQLYIFHATVENNVSIPVVFYLVKGRDEPMYAKLLGMVEELVANEGPTVWNRSVDLLCDFELALINAFQHNYTSVIVRCCFFHFVQNVRKNATKIITT